MAGVNVNADILKWARLQAGLSIEDAARKLQIGATKTQTSAQRLEALESGKEQPLRSVLVRMSKHYRRPLITFYLADEPAKGDRGEDFRKLPDDYTEADDALVDALLRDLKARQSIVRSTLEDEEEDRPLTFIGAIGLDSDIREAAEMISASIGFDRTSFRRKPKLEDAFTYLRGLVESSGVFVLIVDDLGSYHTQIKVEVFRGFALADTVAPFIVVNSQDAKAAWSFTLLHELVHLWLGRTGVSGTFADSAVERFCNDVAGRILLSTEELDDLEVSDRSDFDDAVTQIVNFARRRNLSLSMVAYALYRAQKIRFDRWTELRIEFRRQWIESRDRQRALRQPDDTGPTYYIVRRHRLGTPLVDLVSRTLASGSLSPTKAALVLGVKPVNVHELVRQQAG